MEDAEKLCTIVENKKMLERIKLMLNLSREEDGMNVYATTNTESLQEVTTTGVSNYDNSVRVVVDEDILNQAKEIFRLLRKEDEMKMDQLNVNVCSVDENKNNSKSVKNLMQMYECRKVREESNAMKKMERNQKLQKQNCETDRLITLENLSQHGNGQESEIRKRSKTPHYTPSMRRHKAQTTKYNKHKRFTCEIFPINWTNVSREAGNRLNSTRVILESGQEEYDSILDDFNLSRVSLIQVERFQCTREQQELKLEMDCFRQSKGSGFNFDTKYLYHCTTEKLENASNKGLSVADKGPLGSGIYFSDNPRVCLQQIRRQTNTRVSHMLKCRVILGDVKCYGDVLYKENQDVRRWPKYDSVMGLTDDGLEVVVYNKRRVLVEYIIHLSTASEDRKNDGSE